MKKQKNRLDPSGNNKSTLLNLLKPYSGFILILLLLALMSNGLNLVIPKIIQKGIDDYSAHRFSLKNIVIWFGATSLGIFMLSYAQSVFQVYVSEKVARDIRGKLTYKISQQNFSYIRKHSTARLLTNVTSDADAVKIFISQVAVNIISSGVLIIGSAALLLNINFKLGLIVLIMVPVIIIAFFAVFTKIRGLFKKTQEVMDWLNRVINESILAAALIRILNAQMAEADKFMKASGEAERLGLSIVRLFSILVPIVAFTASLAQLAVLGVGGHFIMTDTMTLGEFAAFNSYIAILIFPILILGFTSSMIARAAASHQRIRLVLDEDIKEDEGILTTPISGDLKIRDLSLVSDGHRILKNISLEIKAGTRTAIIGPTAAGKTQLLNVIAGLLEPSDGVVLFDDKDISEYKQDILLQQIGIVFQDSIIFNLSLKENIAFSKDVTNEELEKAVKTAELYDFVKSRPAGLDTLSSERGASLSGGQKQRIMLARALAVNPTLLLLDDFTARVDLSTEKKISENLKRNYPATTIISVTQKIEPVKDYDQVILLMEGEILNKGTHDELMAACPEYIQLYHSQQSITDVEAAN